jgi:NTP pyrophosphatase (non-canonical NTP hydrolase)
METERHDEKGPMSTDELYYSLEQQNGRGYQISVAIEELSELQKELSKELRGRGRVISIAEEIADVQIVIEQMVRFFDDDGLVQKIKESKQRELIDLVDRGGVK